MRLLTGGQDNDVVIIDIVSLTGKCRLSGHSGPITDALFYETNENSDTNIVITSSVDKQIKLWNIATQCCFRTIVDHTTEIWAIALLRSGDFLVAGSDSSNVNVYRLILNEFDDKNQVGAIDGSIEDDQTHLPLQCNLVGSIKRADTRGRICNLVSDSSGKILSFHGTKSKIIETFLFCTKEDAERRAKKRMKKNSMDGIETNNVSLTDEIIRLPPISVKAKVKSIDALVGYGDNLRIVGTFANNSIRVFALNLKEKKSEPELLRTLQTQGHSSEVRTVCFSSDALAIASADSNSLKLWNRESMKSVQTIAETGYAVCCCFAPGDRHVILGRMDGILLIADIVTGEILEEIPAHQKELWSMTLLGNGSSVVTVGSDATIKFWSFELINGVQSNSNDNSDNLPNRKVLSLLHKNTLKLEETILCVTVSKNSKFLAVGLLDSTVKLFFMDTLKFYLALYGHKLSVLSLDISDDSSLIVTGSADRNVKIWGMDFGDCHKSLFAHNDSVMCVKFVPHTHMFWSCGKDGKVKQWDADTFVQIQSVSPHIGQAFSMDVSKSGHYVVTSGSDRTIRLFSRSDEPIILEDMQEMEREEIEQQQLATGSEETTIPGVIAPLNLPSRKNVLAEQAVELLMDSLEILLNFKDADKIDSIPLLMRAHNAETPIDLIIAVLCRIKPSDLEETLLLLPFTSVCELLKALPAIISKRTDQSELLCKVITFLFRVHRKPIIGNQKLLPFIQIMITGLEDTISEQRDIIGKNLFVLKMIQHDVEMYDLENGAELFYDSLKAKKKRDQKIRMRQLKKKINIQMVS